ncbi:hypothetical protein RR46_12879 [Papilio xuthus]|uniref:Uncharacterized protein n=1 Tax=Papilio xuthus TaxID=66420 RepID=A0A194PLV0_PAPXU|nr:hypothetical protein RR46_12879 [Papilio xuthus]
MYSILRITTCFTNKYRTQTIDGTVRTTENITGISETRAVNLTNTSLTIVESGWCVEGLLFFFPTFYNKDGKGNNLFLYIFFSVLQRKSKHLKQYSNLVILAFHYYGKFKQPLATLRKERVKSMFLFADYPAEPHGKLFSYLVLLYIVLAEYVVIFDVAYTIGGMSSVCQ